MFVEVYIYNIPSEKTECFPYRVIWSFFCQKWESLSYGFRMKMIGETVEEYDRI